MSDSTSDLTAKLVMANVDQAYRLSAELQEHKQRKGFVDGYEAGISEGVYRARLQMREAMGLSSTVKMFCDADEAYEQYLKENIQKD